MRSQKYTAIQLIIRCLTPSLMRGLLCLCLAILIIVLHLLFLSLHFGTSLPGFFDGEWGVAYTNHVVQPLETVLNSQMLGNVLVIIAWGVVGLCMYYLAVMGAHAFLEWREVRRDVQVNDRQLVRHPLQKWFLIILAWRITIVVIAVALFLWAQPFIQRLLESAPELLLGKLPLGKSLVKLIEILLAWALMAHGFVVLIRLFTRRTRFFGDERLY